MTDGLFKVLACDRYPESLLGAPRRWLLYGASTGCTGDDSMISGSEVPSEFIFSVSVRGGSISNSSSPSLLKSEGCPTVNNGLFVVSTESTDELLLVLFSLTPLLFEAEGVTDEGGVGDK